MIYIDYGTISSKIHITNNALNRELNRYLSVKPKNWYFIQKKIQAKYNGSTYDPTVNFYDKETGIFPTGCLNRIISFLKAKGYTFKVRGVPERPTFKNLPLQGVTYRPYQKEAIKRGVVYGRGIFNIATNGGKSEIIAGLVNEINLKTMVLVHKNILFENIYDRLKLRLGDDVGCIKGGKVETDKKITVVMVQTIVKRTYKKHKQYKEVQKFLSEIGVFICDETHHLSSDTWYRIAQNCPAKYRFGFSGTIDKEDPVERMRLEASTGPVLIKVSNDYLIKQGYSMRPEVRIVNFDREVKLSLDNNFDLLTTQIHLNPHRNKLISEIALKHKDLQVLILVSKINQGYEIQNFLEGKISVGFGHGELTKKKRTSILNAFDSGDIKVLIATSILYEGADLKAGDVLINAFGGRADTTVLQGVGRILRKKDHINKVLVYDFNDNFTVSLLKDICNGRKIYEKVPDLRRQASARKKTYLKEGFEVIELKEI